MTEIAPRPCLDCGAPTAGRHCSACGQPTDTGPLTLRQIGADFASNAIGVDGKVPATLRGLALRPGHTIRAYVEGQRTRYVGPFRFAFVATALWFAILSFTVDREQTGAAAIAAWGQFLNLLLIPFLAVGVQLAFTGSRTRYAEHLAVVLYIVGFASLWRAVLSFVGGMVDAKDFELAKAVNLGDAIVFFLYFAWTLWQFHSRSVGVVRRVLGIVVSLTLVNVLSLAMMVGFMKVTGNEGMLQERQPEDTAPAAEEPTGTGTQPATDR